MIHPMIFLLLVFGLASAQFLPNGCPEDFSVHLLLPHETDCGSFYSCSNGQRILMQCAAGTLFDVNIQVCNHAHAVVCQTSETTTELDETTEKYAETTTPIITTTQKTTTTTQKSTTTTPITSTTNKVDEYLSNECPSDFSIHLLLPHESDCNKFYSCSNGRKILMHCPPTLLFDSNSQHCDWPQNVDCNLPTITETTTKGTGNNTTLDLPTTTSSGELEEIITIPSTDPELRTNTTDQPTAVELITTLSLTSNEPATTSAESQGPELAGFPSTPSICPDDFFGVKPHPELCDSYYTCTGWSPIQLFCRPGYEFDPELEKCVEKAEGGCTWAQNPTTNEITTTDAITKNTTISEYTTAAPDMTTDQQTTEELTTKNPDTSETTQEMTTKPLTSPTSEPKETTTELITDPITSSITTADSNIEFSTITPVTEPQTTISTSSTEEPTTPRPELTSTLPQSTINQNSTDVTEQTLPTDDLTALNLTTTESLLPDLPTTVEVSTDETAFTEKEDVISVSTEKLTTIDSSIFTSTTEIWGTTTDQEGTETLEMTSERDTIQTTTESKTEKTSTDTPTTVEVITDRTVITTDGLLELRTETTSDSSTIAQSTENFGTTSNLEGSTQVETEGTTEAAIVCPNDYFGNLPHPESCDAYFLCSGWNPILLFCPSGREFDPVSGLCVPMAEGGCTWQKTSTTTVTEQTTAYTSPHFSTDAVTKDLSSTPDVVTEKESTTGSWETTTSKTTDKQASFETTTEELTSSEPTTLKVTGASTYEATTENFSTITESQTVPDSVTVSETSEIDRVEVTTEKLSTDLPTTAKISSTQTVVTEGQETTVTLEVTPDYDTTTTPTESTSTTTSSKSTDEQTSFETVTVELTTSEPTTLEVTNASTHETTTESFSTITESDTTKSTNASESSTTTVYNSTMVVTTETDLPTASQETTIENVTEETNVTPTPIDSTTVHPDPVIICPDNFFGNLPHPERCDAYFLCSGWDPILLYCPSGNEFDPESGTCVVITEGGCTRQNTTTTSVTEQTTTHTSPDISTDAATEDTSTTITQNKLTTESWETTTYKSTDEQTTFVPTTDNLSTADISTDTVTEDLSTASNDITTEFWDTTTFSKSTDEQTTDETTTEELTTSEPTTLKVTEASTYEATTENLPTNTESQITPESESITTEINTTEDITTDKLSTDLPTTAQVTSTQTVVTEAQETTVTLEATLNYDTTLTPTESTTVQPEAAIICPDNFFGNLPHPERCDAYFLCSGWDPILLFCPSSQEFDPVSGTCIVIAEGGCNWQKTSTTSIIEQTTYSPPDVSTDTVTNDSPATPDFKETTTDSLETTTPSKSTDDDQTTFETTTEELISSKPTSLEVTDASTRITTTESFSTITESQTTAKSTNELENNSTTLKVTDASTYEATTENLPTNTESQTTPESESITTEINTTEDITTDKLSTDLPTTAQVISTQTVVTEAQETTVSLEATSNYDTTSTPTESTTVQPEAAIICPGNFFGNLPHPERCDAYFLCSGWDPILLFCPSSQEFDPVSGTCIVIAEGGCNWQKTSTTSIIEQTTYSPPDVSTDTVTNDSPATPDFKETTTDSLETTTPSKSTDDDQTTFETTTEELISSKPTSLEVTDASTRITTTESFSTITESQTTAKSTNELENSSTTLKVTDASTYEATTENLPTNTESQTTPESESITTEINTTEDITTDKLSTDLPTTAQVTSTQTVVTEAQETTVSLEATSNYDTTSTPTESTTVQPEAAIICPDNFFGNLPHPERCDAYFLCSGWDPILLFCPSSQEFDPVSGTCVVIAEGGCTWQKTSSTSIIEQATTYSPSDVSTDAVTDDLPTTLDLITEKESTTGSWETTTSFKSTDEQTTFETTTEELTSLKPTTLGVTDASTHEATTESFSTITESQTPTKSTNASESSTTMVYKSTMVVTTETDLPTTSQETTIENVTEENDKTLTPTESTTVHPEPVLLCPDNFFGNLPHPERCDAYFLCSGWDPILLYCPSGNEFDPESDRCVVIDEGGCTWQKTNTPSVTEYTTIYTYQDTSTEIATEDISTVDANTGSESTPPSLQTTFEPLTDDLFTLEPTTLEVTETTNHINSEVTTEETITESTTIFEPFTTIDEELSTLGSTTEATEATTPTICPSGFFGSVANPEECDSYYMCSGWMPIPLRCPNGYEFDPIVQSCVQIAEGGCTWKSNSTIQTTTESFSSHFTTREMTTNNQERTTTIQKTTVGEQDPTTKDQKLSTVLQETTTDEISTRITEVTLEITDTTATAAAAITDDAFLPPNPGLPVAPTVVPITIVNTSPEVTAEREETTVDLPTTLEATTEALEVTEEEAICPDGFFGSVPHPEKCDTYYMCSGWMPILLRCSTGFEFNPATQSCVAIADGGCTYSQASRRV